LQGWLPVLKVATKSYIAKAPLAALKQQGLFLPQVNHNKPGGTKNPHCYFYFRNPSLTFAAENNEGPTPIRALNQYKAGF
jgi:hypothetical protein